MATEKPRRRGKDILLRSSKEVFHLGNYKTKNPKRFESIGKMLGELGLRIEKGRVFKGMASTFDQKGAPFRKIEFDLASVPQARIVFSIPDGYEKTFISFKVRKGQLNRPVGELTFTPTDKRGVVFDGEKYYPMEVKLKLRVRSPEEFEKKLRKVAKKHSGIRIPSKARVKK